MIIAEKLRSVLSQLGGRRGFTVRQASAVILALGLAAVAGCGRLSHAGGSASVTPSSSITHPTSPPTSPASLSPSSISDPLGTIFPQVGSGVPFSFTGNNGTIAYAYSSDPGCHRPAAAIGLRLTWDMTGNLNAYGGWGVQWASASPFDASRYHMLVVSVEGAKGGETFQVGLKDTSGKEVKIESKDRLLLAAHTWGQLSIPLTDFHGVNTSQIGNVNLGFNANHKSGQICVDAISFQ